MRWKRRALPVLVGLLIFGALAALAIFVPRAENGHTAPTSTQPSPASSNSLIDPGPILALTSVEHRNATTVFFVRQGENELHARTIGRTTNASSDVTSLTGTNGITLLSAAAPTQIAVLADTSPGVAGAPVPGAHTIIIARAQDPTGPWSVKTISPPTPGARGDAIAFAIDSKGRGAILFQAPELYLAREQQDGSWLAQLLSPQISFADLRIDHTGQTHVCYQKGSNLLEWVDGQETVMMPVGTSSSESCRLLLLSNGTEYALAAGVPAVGGSPQTGTSPDAGTFFALTRSTAGTWSAQSTSVQFYDSPDLSASAEQPCIALIREAQSISTYDCGGAGLVPGRTLSGGIASLSGSETEGAHLALSKPGGPLILLNATSAGGPPSEPSQGPASLRSPLVMPVEIRDGLQSVGYD